MQTRYNPACLEGEIKDGKGTLDGTVGSDIGG
jgi:hypothetical protein